MFTIKTTGLICGWVKGIFNGENDNICSDTTNPPTVVERAKIRFEQDSKSSTKTALEIQFHAGYNLSFQIRFLIHNQLGKEGIGI